MTVKYISDNKISVKINKVDKFLPKWNLSKGETYYLKCYNISDKVSMFYLVEILTFLSLNLYIIRTILQL